MVNRRASALEYKRHRLQERANAVPVVCEECGDSDWGNYTCYWCRVAERLVRKYERDNPITRRRDGGPALYPCCNRFQRPGGWGWETDPACPSCLDTYKRSIRRKLRRREQIESALIRRKRREAKWRKLARQRLKEAKALVQTQKRAASPTRRAGFAVAKTSQT